MVIDDCQTVPGNDVHVAKLFEAHQKIQLYKGSGAIKELFQFSDSIVLTADCSVAGFVGIVVAVAEMQAELLKAKILTRGGIAYGKQFSSGSFIFSQALIESYRIEQEVADGPRVIVSDDLLELLFPDRTFDKSLPLIEEKDGVIFVDYLQTYQLAVCQTIIEMWEYFHSHPVFGDKYDWLLEFAKFKWPSVTLPNTRRFIQP